MLSCITEYVFSRTESNRWKSKYFEEIKEWGYIKAQKMLKDNKAVTQYQLTSRGWMNLKSMKVLEKVLTEIKKNLKRDSFLMPMVGLEPTRP